MESNRKNRWLRVIISIFLAIAAIILLAVLFMRFFPSFGGRASSDDRSYYAEHAEYYDGTHFAYPEAWKDTGLTEDVRVSVKETAPADTLPVLLPEFAETPALNDLRITWMGHSSILVQMHGKTVFIDPVFSKRTSPVSFIGPQRFTEPSFTPDEIPHLDAVLISHDHYDHLDMHTIQALNAKTDFFIVPLGIENHLERWGIPSEKIRVLAWWENTKIDELELICAPSRHQSGRGLRDINQTLWCAWILRDDTRQIFESGDAGYGKHFAEIHERYGDFDLVMLDCAQFNLGWHYNHMFPEESAMAAETLGAKAAMPIHWGTFVLSNHGWDDPPERFTLAAEARGINVLTPQLCETMNPDEPAFYQNRWWRNYH